MWITVRVNCPFKSMTPLIGNLYLSEEVESGVIKNTRFATGAFSKSRSRRLFNKNFKVLQSR